MSIYLDNSATTRPFKEVIAAISLALEERFYNPSSLYAQGLSSKKLLDQARSKIANMLSAKQVVFTSGGTEANNLAIHGCMENIRKKSGLLYSAVEHSAVALSCKRWEDQHHVQSLPVDRLGILDLQQAEKMMSPETALICVMQVNNEVGAVQPLDQLIQLRDHICPDALIHVDGVQGFLRLPITLATGIDSYAMSAHKVHGPKGVGALALGSRFSPKPQQDGGGQEAGYRSGTENTAGIAGFVKAIDHQADPVALRNMKLRLYQRIQEHIPQFVLNGPQPDSPAAAPHILNLSFPPVMGQTMMHALEAKGVLVSQGSACSGRQKKKSATLVAMGVDAKTQDSAIRFSIGAMNTMEEMDQAAWACKESYQELKKFVRR